MTSAAPAYTFAFSGPMAGAALAGIVFPAALSAFFAFGSFGIILGVGAYAIYGGLTARSAPHAGPAAVPVLLGVGAFFLALGVWAVSRADPSYTFTAGRLTSVSAIGRVLWSEDLTNADSLSLLPLRYGMVLTVRWPGHKRSFNLPMSLATVIHLPPAVT